MPLLIPHDKETQNEFISRFVQDKNMRKEFPNRKQRLAIAYNQWREK